MNKDVYFLPTVIVIYQNVLRWNFISNAFYSIIMAQSLWTFLLFSYVSCLPWPVLFEIAQLQFALHCHKFEKYLAISTPFKNVTQFGKSQERFTHSLILATF